MTWFQIKREVCGYGRDSGPPPSIRLGFLRLSWWRGDVPDLLDKMRRALNAAREEMRK